MLKRAGLFLSDQGFCSSHRWLLDLVLCLCRALAVVVLAFFSVTLVTIVDDKSWFVNIQVRSGCIAWARAIRDFGLLWLKLHRSVSRISLLGNAWTDRTLFVSLGFARLSRLSTWTWLDLIPFWLVETGGQKLLFSSLFTLSLVTLAAFSNHQFTVLIQESFLKLIVSHRVSGRVYPNTLILTLR